MIADISLKLMFSKRRRFIFTCLMIVISTMIIFSVSSVLGLIQEVHFMKVADTYGEHHYIYFDVTDKQLDQVISQKFIEKAGLIETVGSVQITDKDKSITLGCMDENVLKLGHIKLLRGRFPKSDRTDEIVLEEQTAVQLGDMDIGSTIILTIPLHGQQKSQKFIVTGIIYNYSGVWNVPLDSKVGYHDLPSAIISDRYIKEFDGTTIKNLLVKFKCNKISDDYSCYNSNIKETIGIGGNSAVQNDNLYMECMGEIVVVRKLAWMFMICFCIGVALCIRSVYNISLCNDVQIIQIMKSIGANNDSITKIIFYQWIFLLGCGVPLGLLLGYFFRNTLLRIIIGRSLIEVSQSAKDYLITIAAICLSALWAIKTELDGNVQKSVIRKRRGRLSDFKFPIFAIMLGDKFSNRRKNICLIFAVAFSIVIFCITRIYIYDFCSDNSDAILPDYVIAPFTIETFKRADRFKIVQNHHAISFKDVHMIEQDRHVKYIEKEPSVQGATILLDERQLDPYWEQWNECNQFDRRDFREPSIEGIGVPKDIFPVEQINFVVLNKMEFKIFNHHMGNNKLDQKEYADKDKVILCLPAFQIDDMNIHSSLKYGEHIVIGRIEQSYNLNQDIEYSGKMKYVSFDVEVGDVFNAPFYFKIDDIEISSHNPTLVMTEEMARRLGIVKGYERLGIYLRGSLSKAGYMKFENTIKNIAGKYPNAEYLSNREFEEKNKVIRNILEITGNILTLLIAFYSVFESAIIAYMHILTHRREYTIYRILGMNKKQLIMGICLENAIYIILAILLGGIITFGFAKWVELTKDLLSYIRLLYLKMSFAIFIISQIFVMYSCKEFYETSLANIIIKD